MDNQAIQTKESGKASAILDSIIRQGLARFAALYNLVPSDVLPGIWFESLKDLTPEVVAGALLRVEREFVPTHACPFPVPATVRGVLEGVKANENKVLAEDAWKKTLRWIDRNYHPDVKYSDQVELDRKSMRALNAAGGPHWVSTCDQDQLPFARKAFLEAYEQLDKLGKDEFFIGNAEAKNILAEITDLKRLA